MLRFARVYDLRTTLGGAGAEAYQKVLLPPVGAARAPVP